MAIDDKEFDNIEEVDLKKKMEDSYIDYAMSVIASRALPDVRDGLKPVQRRILYSMIELNNGPDKPHRKCARIVGDTMGKYHPHGDSSIYGALVTMAQDWNMRYPLVDGHGNFGSVDGDGAAAMRYTEARLSKISMEMVRDLGKDTVDFVPNFDDTEKEPTVLPARIPNLLVNGATGIAVGMATNIPTHNLREVISAVVKIIDNHVDEGRDTTIDEILPIIKGPDFPTGAEILGKAGINEAYRTGRGKIRVRGVTNIETMSNGKSQIVITELPYMVNKARLIEKIAELVRDKKIDGITAINDHSSREGMRVVIELRRDANANVILNKLYKHTQLQDTFGVIMLALVDNQPKVLNILQLLNYYLGHQEDVVTRRTKYDLNKALERANVLEGLLKALDIIDEVIETIRASANTQDAKNNLIAKFGFNEPQAQAIVDMRLKTLTGLEREKLQAEYDELQKKIIEYREILADPNKLLGVIRSEILEISEKYGDDRRTKIVHDTAEITTEDLIPVENTVITMSHLGYIKRMDPDNFHSQNRGGKGIKGTQNLSEDYVEDIFMTGSHDYLMFYTNLGRAYTLKAYQIPEAGRTARGTAIVNLLQLMPGEEIRAVIPISEFREDQYIFMATKKGIVKKTPVPDFRNMRKTGLAAITLKDDDDVIEVKYTSGHEEIFLATRQGMAIRFHEEDVRPTGRGSMGVYGIRLKKDDEVIGMQLRSQGDYLLFATENGLGKRTKFDEFHAQTRGGLGVHAIRLVERSGALVGVKAVNEDNDIMLITDTGIIIRTPVSGISVLGRDATGVKLMSVAGKVAGLAKVRRDDDEDDGKDGSIGEDDLKTQNNDTEEDSNSAEDSPQMDHDTE